MNTISMIAYERKILHKAHTAQLRKEGQVPCVIYGSAQQPRHASIPAILFRPLLKSQQAHFIDINLEGVHIQCILQDIQYHPVSDSIIHADFLILSDEKPIRMQVPVHVQGEAPGALQGGKLQIRLRKLRVKALPKHMPTQIEIDISQLELGKIVKIKDLKQDNYQIQDNPVLPVVGMQVPKALRSTINQEEASATEATSVDT